MAVREGVVASTAVRGAPRATHPLPPSSRRQQLVDLLREEIITGGLAAGEQLKQDLLCKEFSVSQAPVREALRQLEAEGLVQHVPNRGVFVTDLNEDELLGVLLPVRLAIESFAVPKALPELRRAGLSMLDGIVDAMQAAARVSDLAAINELDVQFHEMTVAASGSIPALQLWRSVQPRIRVLIYRLAPRHRKLDEIVAEHRLLVDTIRGGTTAALRRMLQEHIIASAVQLLSAGDGHVSASATGDAVRRQASRA